MTETASLARRINGERLVVLGWSRAILMQIAHPLVAAGVADHSSFRRGGVAAVSRLYHTIRAMRRLTFGDEADRADALERILAIHRRVHGRLASSVGGFSAGTRYSAEDPALVLWVHATLVDSLSGVYDLVVEPLSDEERDQFCADAAETAVRLGAYDPDVPRSWAVLQRYIASMFVSGAIVVGDQARALAGAVLQPPLGILARPLTAVTRLVTVGLLPDALRQAYGLPWTDRDERRMKTTLRLIRRARRVTPAGLALWPDARARRA